MLLILMSSKISIVPPYRSTVDSYIHSTVTYTNNQHSLPSQSTCYSIIELNTVNYLPWNIDKGSQLIS